MSTTHSSTAEFVRIALEQCDKTHREIAREVGIATPNVISMMKTGDIKVPINRIPALAKAMGVDAYAFTEIAMREYHPELWQMLTEHYRGRASGADDGDRLLQTIRDILDGRAVEWSPAFEAALTNLIELVADYRD